MKNLSKREKFLIATLLILAFGYAYVTLLLLPIIKGINSTSSNINKYNNEIKIQTSNKAILESKKKSLDDIKNKLKELSIAIPEDERNPELAYNLKSEADKTKVSVTSVSVGQPAPLDAKNSTQNDGGNNNTPQALAGRIMIIPVSVQVNGNYNSIVNFIASVENGKRVAEVSDVNLSGGSAANAQSAVQAAINIRFYYIEGGDKRDTKYDFNNGSYGKDDLFK